MIPIEIIYDVPLYIYMCFFYLLVLITIFLCFWRSVTSNNQSLIKPRNIDSPVLIVNGYIDVKDPEGIWLEGQIKKLEPNRIFIHYLGWDMQWDEWIHKKDSQRYAPLHTFSKPKEISMENRIQRESIKKGADQWLECLAHEKYSKYDDLELKKQVDGKEIDKIISDLSIKKVPADIIRHLHKQLLWIQSTKTHERKKNIDHSVGNRVEILRNSGEWIKAEIVDIDHVKQLYSVKWRSQGEQYSKLVSTNELRPLSHSVGNKVEILRNSGEWTKAEIVNIDHTKQLYNVKWFSQGEQYNKLVSTDELRSLSQYCLKPLSTPSPPKRHQNLKTPPVSASQINLPPAQKRDQVEKLCGYSWKSPRAFRKRNAPKFKDKKKLYCLCARCEGKRPTKAHRDVSL